MSISFLIKRGNLEDLPDSLSTGEGALTVDEGGLYYGINDVPVKISDKALCNNSVTTLHNHSYLTNPTDNTKIGVRVTEEGQLIVSNSTVDVLRTLSNGVEVFNGSQWITLVGYKYVEKDQTDSPYQAVDGDFIFYDCSTSIGTITLPSTPILGSEIVICDVLNYSNTYNITVSRNGNNIDSLASDYTINTNGATIKLIYVNATIGWKIHNMV